MNEETQETNEVVEHFEPIGDATYSPEDNKIRIFPYERLDNADYLRLKEAGYKWGRFQQNFVAPMWTPKRWDLAVELCGEVGDDTQTTEERAAQRAERFERYKANRHRDAYNAADTVQQLTEHIPAGQPILIGHHSQKHAERIAKKINRAMETAVDQWSRHDYWTGRIPAVLRHAEWKNDEGLRHRRIKGLEADERKHVKEINEDELFMEAWQAKELTRDRVLSLANHCHISTCFPLAKYPRPADVNQYEGMKSVWSAIDDNIITPEQAKEICTKQLERNISWHQRWLDHTRLRLSYEREVMEQAGGSFSERWDIQPGGKVQTARDGEQWVTVLKVNKAHGKVNSITTTTTEIEKTYRGSQKILKIEKVTAYEPPTQGESVPKAARRKPLPLCNYQCEESVSMTTEEYKAIPERHRENRPCYPKGKKQWEARATHRRTSAWIEDLSAWGGATKWVYLTDKKTKQPPTEDPKPTQPTPAPEQVMDMPEPTMKEVMEQVQEETPAPAAKPVAQPTLFDQMKETLKAGGVQTVCADQLFPTPPDLAKRMVEYARVQPGDCVLEPSAGTGNIIQAVRDAVDTEIMAYEINQELCSALRSRFESYEMQVRQRDFLEVDDFMEQYPVVLMNPPFSNGADIKHINHALKFLRPGGVLVAICANGPRQQREFMDRAEHWEELPAGTFKSQGTMVNTALLVLRKD